MSAQSWRPGDTDGVAPHIVEVRLRLLKKLLAEPMEEILNLDLDRINELRDFELSVGRWSVEAIPELWFGKMPKCVEDWCEDVVARRYRRMTPQNADEAWRDTDETQTDLDELDVMASALGVGVRLLQKIARLHVQLGAVPYDRDCPHSEEALTIAELDFLQALLRAPVFPEPSPGPWAPDFPLWTEPLRLGFYHMSGGLSAVFPHLTRAARGLSYVLVHAPTMLQRCRAPISPAQRLDYEIGDSPEDSPDCGRFFVKTHGNRKYCSTRCAQRSSEADPKPLVDTVDTD